MRVAPFAMGRPTPGDRRLSNHRRWNRLDQRDDPDPALVGAQPHPLATGQHGVSAVQHRRPLVGCRVTP